MALVVSKYPQSIMNYLLAAALCTNKTSLAYNIIAADSVPGAIYLYHNYIAIVQLARLLFSPPTCIAQHLIQCHVHGLETLESNGAACNQLTGWCG